MIQPLNNNVLLRRDEAESKTASGILIADSAKEKVKQATVVAVGQDATAVKHDDRVFYEDFTETTVKYEGEELILVSEDNILATID